MEQPETKHKLFVNLTNHPHSSWGEEQLSEAAKYGEIVDIAFPMVEPDYGSEEIKQLAETYVAKIERLIPSFNITLHIMGEMTFTFAVVSRLKALGITCLASTTERNTVMMPDGKKVSEFKFVQFREY